MQYYYIFSEIFKADMDERNCKLDKIGLLATFLLIPTVIVCYLTYPLLVFLDEHVYAPYIDALFPSITNLIITKLFLIVFTLYLTPCFLVSAWYCILLLFLYITFLNTYTELFIKNCFVFSTKVLSMKSAVNMYSQIYIVNNLFNSIIYLCGPPLLACFLPLHLLCIFCVLRLYSHLHFILYILFVLGGMFFFLEEFVILQNLSISHHNSIRFIQLLQLHPQSSRLGQKILISLQPICIKVGPFFHFQRSTFVTFMFILCDYTITLLLAVIA